MNIRQKLFWLLDSFQGGVVKNHMLELHNSLQNEKLPFCNADENKKIQSLLNHAVESVPFYYCYQNIPFSQFPVVDKNLIRENASEFMSKFFDAKACYPAITSGSTGTPFKVFHDLNKKKRTIADTIYFADLAGYTLGEQLVYMKIWNSVNRKGKFSAWMQNIFPKDVTTLSEENIAQLVEWLKSNNTRKNILSYASALEAVCGYIDRYEPTTKINNVASILAMSESLSDYTKASTTRIFSTTALSRYSNVENGIIAQQTINGNHEFTVNWGSYFVEVLKMDSPERQEYGIAGRIIVTDLYNYAMPMIRYDTGDVGVLDWDADGKKIILKNIEGRRMDLVFDTLGNLVSSFTITNNMWLYPEIKQYQFIQETPTQYLFKLNLEGAFLREEELINEFTKHFGKDANIKVEYVNEIPLLSSGKRKKVMNKMTN